LLGAAGAMGLGEFWHMTPREFFARHNGFVADRERASMDTYESARLSAFISIQPHLSKSARLKPTDLIVFPWERKAAPPKPELSEAQRAAIYSKWDNDLKKTPKCPQ
jgi:hypothetical protein